MALNSSAIDCAVLVRPHPDFAAATCGDYGVVKTCGSTLFIGLLDALGHGPEAAKVIDRARPFLDACDGSDLVQTMGELHEHLRGTLGAVAGLACLDMATGELRYAGIGNITAKVYGTQYIHFVPRSGIVGYAMPEPRANTFNLGDGDVLVIHSDGIPEHLNLKDYPELLAASAEDISEQVMKRFSKAADDAGCIVVKYQK
jgi:serine phosphatase RsbU (regulator of sigma subunit)